MSIQDPNMWPDDIRSVIISTEERTTDAKELLSLSDGLRVAITKCAEHVRSHGDRPYVDADRLTRALSLKVELEETPLVGFWVACYGDLSRIVIFNEEIDCLRYAVEHHTLVVWVLEGESLNEAMNRRFAANKGVRND